MAMPDTRVTAGGSVAERLAMCDALLRIQGAISAAPLAKRDRAKVLGAMRIRALRNSLLGLSAGRLIDGMLNPTAAPRVLDGLLSNAAGQPPAERERVATYVQEIARMLFTVMRSESASGVSSASDSALVTVHAFAGQLLSNDVDTADAAVDSHITRGRFGDDLRERAAEAASAPGALTVSTIRLEDVAPELAAELAAYNAERERRYSAYRKAMMDYSNAESPDERKRLDDLMVELHRAYVEYRDGEEHAPLTDKIDRAMRGAMEAAQAPLREAGQLAIDDVMNGSPISQEEAEAWSAGVEITKAAAARLKKLGYPVEAVRADMAEFYRLTRGRVSKVKIDSKGDRRANAPGIDRHGTTGSVMLGSSFGKRTLWHELAHHIEADPVAKKASGRLIRRRSVDGKAYTLKSLTGNPGYRSSEVAYKDGFFSPYVGKIYKDGITEVFSMGVESFSDPLMLARRIAEDPETLEFVAGYLKAEIDPLERAFLDLRNVMEELNSEATGNEAETLDGLLAALAARVEITKDTDTSWNAAWGYKGKQIGTAEGWYILEDRVRDYYGAGGRKVAGFMLVKPTVEPDPYREGGVRRVAKLNSFPSRDKTLLRAALAVFQKTGSFPSQSELNNVAFLQSHIDDNQP